MMIARFRIVGWVAGCAVAALCCYLASQRVASERLALAKVDREIVDTRADNARLETEIATRSRLGQIERWNVAFRLGAPSPRQYLANEVQLAAYVGGRPLPVDPAIQASKGAVDTVAYTPGAPAAASAPTAQAPAPQPTLRPAPVLARPAPLPVPVVVAVAHVPALGAAKPLQTVSAPAAPAAPMLRQASYVRPKPDRLAGVDSDAPVVKASLVKLAPARPSRLDDILDDPAPRKAKPERRPDRKATAALLPSDLGALAAAEGKPHGKKADR